MVGPRTTVSLAQTYPEIAAQWHPIKNGAETPNGVTAKSGVKRWWICSKGHEWFAVVASRTKGSNCPFCAGKKVTTETSLLALNPKLAHQWHPTMNGDLTPAQVPPSGSKVVWWQCEKGHEWQSSMNNRSKGQGCPYCERRRASSENNLAVAFPEIAAQWHPTKNVPVNPEQVSPNSRTNFWWICSKGHEWLISPNGRRDRGCPYCANKAVNSENSLAITQPELAAEWHPSKNFPLTPEGLTWGSSKKVWWKCRYGHEWQTTVANRSGLNTACPKCSPQSSRLEIRIYAEFFKLLGSANWREKISGMEADIFLPSINIALEVDGAYWHSAKVEKDAAKQKRFADAGVLLLRIREFPLQQIGPNDVVFQSKQSHEEILPKIAVALTSMISDLSQRQIVERYAVEGRIVAQAEYLELLSKFPGPAKGRSLVDVAPEIAGQWNQSKNEALLPSMFSVGSSLKVWWRCEHGHEWQSSISGRTGKAGNGCPFCAGRLATASRNLSTEFPEVATQWNFSKNIGVTPKDISPHSGKKYWWSCKKGHDYYATVDGRVRGSGCPYCSGARLTNERSFAAVCPELVAQLNVDRSANADPAAVTAFSANKVWWRCLSGHEWEATWGARASGTGCPYCAGNLVSPEASLATLHPDLVEEWDVDRNMPLTPDQIRPGSGIKVWWHCCEGHIWQAAPYTRVKGHGCQKCAQAAKVASRALNLDTVISWIKNYLVSTGKIPTQYSGVVIEAPDENWNSIYQALRQGRRGLPKVGGIRQLLERES